MPLRLPKATQISLLLLLVLLLGGGFASTSLVSYYTSREALRNNIINSELPLTSDTVYSEIQKDLVRPVLISSMMARDTFLRDWVVAGEQDPAQMTRYLQEIMSAGKVSCLHADQLALRITLYIQHEKSLQPYACAKS